MNGVAFLNASKMTSVTSVADEVHGGMLEVRDFKKRAKEGEMGEGMHHYYDRSAAPCTWDAVCISMELISIWNLALIHSRIQMTDYA